MHAGGGGLQLQAVKSGLEGEEKSWTMRKQQDMILCCGVRARTKDVQCSYYLNVEIFRSLYEGWKPEVLSGIKSGRRDREKR